MTDQAQALRELARNPKSRPTQVIAVTSGKGGVGKSSLALNMAISLSRRGRRTLIIDSDFGFSNIDVMLGVKTKYDLLDVIKLKMDIHDIVEQGLEGVQFISGGSGVYELTKLSGKQLMDIFGSLSCLEDIADTIIFDTGAGVNDNMLKLFYASNETVLVTTPEPTAVVDAYALIKIISEKVKGAKINLVLNKTASVREAASVMEGLVRIAKKNLDIDINKLGHIMRDENMPKAIKMQVPILVSYPKCMASINIDSITAKLLKNPVKGLEKPGILSFFERLAGKNGEGVG